MPLLCSVAFDHFWILAMLMIVRGALRVHT
jgi:hypothetical protein